MSKKYINADALISDIKQMRNTSNGYSDTFDKSEIVGVIEEQPAADVVEVVRCGQCKFFQSRGCFIGIQGAQISSDNYCAWGQRKDG